MTAAERYLLHLKRIIDACAEPAQIPDPSAETLRHFLDGIAGERIRISKTDWQGHGLPALVWNMPSLKPSIKTIVIRHVVDRWNGYQAGATADLPEPEAVDRNDTETFPNDHDPGVFETGSSSEHASSQQTEPLPTLTGTAVSRRDWFDRFTDWVAAIVSLWK